jgi:hypothetical protein
MESIAQLVQKAINEGVRVAPVSLHRLPPPSSRVWSARVIVRASSGCHLRVGEDHDVFIPTGYLDDDADRYRVRIQPDGLAVLHSM